MSEEEEYLFQQSNSCWICLKLIDHDHEKVRGHCYITGRFRCAAHWSCNIKINVTTFNVIPNGLEKYLAFCMNKNLILIDSMQLLNYTLDELVKNLSDEDFKYLVEQFGSKNLELFEQKDTCLMST